MSRIAACVIAYQSEDKLPKLLKSLEGHVDVLVLGIDRKTTDKTRELAEAWAKRNKKIQFITHDFLLEDSEDKPDGPKNFDRARNENWALIPKDCDWGFWIDTDDVLHADANLHQIADEQPDDVSQVWLLYSYFRNEHGNVTTMFWRERLVRLKVPGKWIRRLHEICVSASGRHVQDKRAWIEHENRTDESTKGDRNFTTLRAILKDEPNDQWAILYLALQHFGALQYQEAADNFLKFISLNDNMGERWQAFLYAAKSFRLDKQFAKAKEMALAAISENPSWADPYFELCAVYADMCVGSNDANLQRRFAEKAVAWYEEGKRHPQPDDPRLMKNPLDYDYNPNAIVQVCYQILGDLPRAKSLLDEAIAIGPDPRLVEVRDMYTKVLDRRAAITAGLNLAGHLFSSGEPLKARDVLSALPVDAASETRNVSQVRQAVQHELSFADSDNAYENRYFLDPETDEPSPDRPTAEEKWLLRRLQDVGAKRVLDVGIGNGQTAFYLAKNGIQVVGLDIDPRRVKNANFAAVKFGFLEKKYSKSAGRAVPVMVRRGKPIADLPVQFWYGSIERAPATIKERGPYDAVLLDGILHRVRNVDLVIPAAEALAPRVLITVPDGTSLTYEAQKGTLRVFGQMDVEGLVLERGRIVESHHVGNLVTLEYVTGIAPHRNSVPPPAVVIWCGPGWEPWTPEQINDKGLGGSETAVVHLAEEMVKRGLRVMVYAEAEGTWNGVHYRKWDKLNPAAPVWAFIAWRNPTIIDQPIQAELKYLWMHDTDCGPALTKERADKFDSILVLSKWHRDHMRQKYALDVDRFTIIGNGIVPSRFNTDVSRTNTVIYSSSPDRGLEQVLELWPEIRRRTGAELRILYGWENFDLMGGPRDFKKKILEMAKADGVTWVGRVGQVELAQEMAQAKVLFYPGPHPFNETFCITALEAQAAGCVPVTRNNGALPETNKFGIVLPNDSKPKRWFAAIQEALNATEEERTKMRDWALGQTWEAVANRVIQRSIEIDSARQQQETQLA